MSLALGYDEYSTVAVQGEKRAIGSSDYESLYESLRADGDEIPVEAKNVCPRCHHRFPFPLTQCPECHLDLRNWKRECNASRGREDDDNQEKLKEKIKRMEDENKRKYEREKNLLRMSKPLMIVTGVIAIFVLCYTAYIVVSNPSSVSNYDGKKLIVIVIAFIAYLLGPALNDIIRKLIMYIKVSNSKWIKLQPKLKGLLKYEQLLELHQLQKEFKIYDERFLDILFQSAALGTKIIKKDYDELKRLFPDRSEKRILRELLVRNFSVDPDVWRRDIDGQADKAMTTIHNIEQLCIYIETIEKKHNPDYYESTLGRRIEEIILK